MFDQNNLTLHPFAHKAGQAAECADDQGRFWDYHDVLFQNQRALDVESLKLYAETVGLDTEDFGACLDSGAKAQLVLDDVQNAQNYGVRATPTFFITEDFSSSAGWSIIGPLEVNSVTHPGVLHMELRGGSFTNQQLATKDVFGTQTAVRDVELKFKRSG